MSLEEIGRYLKNSDNVKIIVNDIEIFCGYWALFRLAGGGEEKSEQFRKHESDEVKEFRCVPETRHTKWRQRNLMPPSEPEKGPDLVSADELEMKLYYTIWI